MQQSRGQGRLAGLVVAILFGAILARAADEVLTNQMVIEMTKLRLSDANIIDQIENSKCNFTVTASAVIALRQQGVSNGVIAAMTAKMRGKTGAAPRNVPPPGAPEQGPAPAASELNVGHLPMGQWTVPDSMDASSRQALFLDSRFLVSATCSAKGLRLEFRYRKRGGFRMSQDKPEMLKLSDGKPYVAVPVSIDGEQRITMFGAPGAQTNEVTVTAAGQDDAEAFKTASGMAKAFGMDAGAVLSIAEIYRAGRIVMRFPLDNGEDADWTFEPHDAMFRKFGSGCNAILPRLGFGAENRAGETTAPDASAGNPMGMLGNFLDAVTGKTDKRPEMGGGATSSSSTVTPPAPVSAAPVPAAPVFPTQIQASQVPLPRIGQLVCPGVVMMAAKDQPGHPFATAAEARRHDRLVQAPLAIISVFASGSGRYLIKVDGDAYSYYLGDARASDSCSGDAPRAAGSPGGPQVGQFVCAGTVIAPVGNLNKGLRVGEKIRIVELGPNGLGDFKLAGDNKIYVVVSGRAPQDSCRR
jgi:hypothetical protein